MNVHIVNKNLNSTVIYEQNMTNYSLLTKNCVSGNYSYIFHVNLKKRFEFDIKMDMESNIASFTWKTTISKH